MPRLLLRLRRDQLLRMKLPPSSDELELEGGDGVMLHLSKVISEEPQDLHLAFGKFANRGTQLSGSVERNVPAKFPMLKLKL